MNTSRRSASLLILALTVFALLVGLTSLKPAPADESAADVRATVRSLLAAPPSTQPVPVGVQGKIGPTDGAKTVHRLSIRTPGDYVNYVVDGEWSDRTLVKISADGVALRNCEIRNATDNGVTIEAEDVLIENCRIHHLLKGTFDEQDDAHGVTGRPRRLVVRNCEIHHVSGDALQFDPGRGDWGDVLIENCTLWTGPLDADAADFRRGERPGENALDTKADPKHGRSRIVVRNCLFHGWGNGQIDNQAALNLKENVAATVENCVFRDNDVAFRLRGNTGRGNADVSISRCAVYDSKLVIRAEDRLANLKVDALGFGGTIGRRMKIVGGKLGPGFSERRLFEATPFDAAVAGGVPIPRD